MGDREKASLRLQFNPQIRLEFHGATITSDAGLLAFRELDDALDLTPIASDYLQESRTGRNIRHHLVPLLRQSIYSRLAGYDDTNDAERLSQDPAMRVVVGWQGSDRNAARTNTMSRFETETLTQEDNLKGLALMNPHLMQMLGRLFLHREESKDELTQLSDITLGLRVDVLGPLGSALTTLPAGDSYPGLTAGPSFRFSRDVNTPPHLAAARALFIERLKELSAYCGFLQTQGAISSVLARVRGALAQYAEQLSKF